MHAGLAKGQTQKEKAHKGVMFLTHGKKGRGGH
jgi:hypothetical protein